MSEHPSILIGHGSTWQTLPATASDYDIARAVSEYTRTHQISPEVRRETTGRPARPVRSIIAFGAYRLAWSRLPMSLGVVSITPDERQEAGVICEGSIDLDGAAWSVRVYHEGVVSVLRAGIVQAAGVWDGEQIVSVATGDPLTFLPAELSRVVLANLVARVRTYRDDAVVAPEQVASLLADIVPQHAGDILIPYVGLRVDDDWTAVTRREVDVLVRPYVGHGDFGYLRPPESRVGVYSRRLKLDEAAALFGTDLLYLRLGAEPAVFHDARSDQMLCKQHGAEFGMTTPPNDEIGEVPCGWCISRMHTGMHPLAGVGAGARRVQA